MLRTSVQKTNLKENQYFTPTGVKKVIKKKTGMHILEWFSTLIVIVIDEKFHPAHLSIYTDLQSGREKHKKYFPTFNNDFHVYNMRMFLKYILDKSNSHDGFGVLLFRELKKPS